MVISDRYRYIYFVAPKCGSATTRHALAPFTDIGYPVTDAAEHVTVRRFLEKFDDEGRFDTYFRFTVVRNPYDRAYSAFRQDIKASKTWDAWIDAKAPIFAEIGEDFERYLLEHVARADLLSDWEWQCFCPTKAFAYLGDERVVHWTGRVERLSRDLSELADILGVRFEKIGHFNSVSVAADEAGDVYRYLSAYTPETIACVNALYADDFDAFGYRVIAPDELSDVPADTSTMLPEVRRNPQ